MEHKFDSGDQGVIAYKSSNPFEFFHILNSKEQDEQDKEQEINKISHKK